MKVGLFAPAMRPEWGGVWQFAQILVAQVGGHVPLCVVLPSAMLAEMGSDAVDSAVEVIDADAVLDRARRTLAFRVLEDNACGNVGGVTVPFAGRTTRWIRRRFYHGTVAGTALLGEMQRADVNVVHVPSQSPRYPDIVRQFPYVINPHDYQHEHFPEFFTPEELSKRRNVWYDAQRRAAALVVHSMQTRDDAVKYVGVPEERVFYAPYGPLATFPRVDEPTARRAAAGLDLPERFVFYPARTWPHKNHVALLEAVAQLKQRGIEVNCVFTDAAGDHAPRVHERAEALGLAAQVRVVGRVTPDQMGALYTLCTAVVVPSLFEQNSGPMLEAIQFGKAVAVSHLPELVNTLDGAGLVFNPHAPAEIAAAIDGLWSSDRRRAEVEDAVRRRRDRMSWEPFREVYRKAYAFALERGNP